MRKILHLIAQPFTFVKIGKTCQIKPTVHEIEKHEMSIKSNSTSKIDLFKDLRLNANANEKTDCMYRNRINEERGEATLFLEFSTVSIESSIFLQSFKFDFRKPKAGFLNSST